MAARCCSVLLLTASSWKVAELSASNSNPPQGNKNQPPQPPPPPKQKKKVQKKRATTASTECQINHLEEFLQIEQSSQTHPSGTQQRWCHRQQALDGRLCKKQLRKLHAVAALCICTWASMPQTSLPTSKSTT